MVDDPSATDGTPEAGDVADYVATMSRGLATMAKQARLPILAYILEMATVEAESSSPQLRKNGQGHN